ncbi:MAG: hypothetical protein ACRDPF_27610, partial [Streptosporangiaceae bacterium]
VVGGRIGMAIGVVRFRTPPQALGLTPAQDYGMWALAGDGQCFGVPDTELAALVVAAGLPLILETAFLFDLLVAVVVFGMLIRSHHTKAESLSTADLTRLRG